MENLKDRIIEVGFAGAFFTGLSVLALGIVVAIGEAINNIKEFFGFGK